MRREAGDGFGACHGGCLCGGNCRVPGHVALVAGETRCDVRPAATAGLSSSVVLSEPLPGTAGQAGSGTLDADFSAAHEESLEQIEAAISRAERRARLEASIEILASRPEPGAGPPRRRTLRRRDVRLAAGGNGEDENGRCKIAVIGRGERNEECKMQSAKGKRQKAKHEARNAESRVQNEAIATRRAV